MQKLFLAALCSMLAATPAFATGGMICRTAGAHPVELAVVISRTVVASVVSARLTDNGRQIPLAIAQS